MSTKIPATPGFYKLVHRRSGHYYGGSTSNLRRRLANHKHMVNATNHHNATINKIFEKWEDVEVVVFPTESLESARETEQRFLDANHGESLCCNTGNNSTRPWTPGTAPEEYRERGRKVGLSNTGIKRSPETLVKMSEAHKGKSYGGGPSKAVKIDGVTYKSVSDASTALGHSRKTIQKRVASTLDGDKDWMSVKSDRKKK